MDTIRYVTENKSLRAYMELAGLLKIDMEGLVESGSYGSKASCVTWNTYTDDKVPAKCKPIRVKISVLVEDI